MAFVQLIEYRTSRRAELDKLMDGWMSATQGKRTAARSVTGKDRDRPDTYIDIVEFPSYEEAMRNSDLPETGEFAKKIAELCDGEPIFRNLDVTRTDEL
jgi:hypothetical protein